MIKHALLLSFLLITNLGICADKITIEITGKITPSPCIVADEDEIVAVNLGDNISADKLERKGKDGDGFSDWTSFALKLTNCPAGTTTSIAAFSGIPDPDSEYSEFYKNTGDAENIAIEVVKDDASMQRISHGSTWSRPVGENRAVTWDMKARVVGKGNVVPGTVSTTITVTFTYQ